MLRLLYFFTRDDYVQTEFGISCPVFVPCPQVLLMLSDLRRLLNCGSTEVYVQTREFEGIKLLTRTTAAVQD
jgi:hypothetical protein